MAPEIAIQALQDLSPGEVILDPMVGSGTVLHHAAQNKLKTIGFDLDPLAILISSVRTSKINLKKFDKLSNQVINGYANITLSEAKLPWISDQETKEFIKFWFGIKQANALRKISFLLYNLQNNYGNTIELDALKLALSRIIITKKVGASLAWDVSHSRPHKVKDKNDYDTFSAYIMSLKTVRTFLERNSNVTSNGKIITGDARNLKISNNSIDKVITSPPYLNAIDYMRGHKFSLIWLGYTIPQLRAIRSEAIGVEKAPSFALEQAVETIFDNTLKDADLKIRQKAMIKRYIKDSIDLMSEISRVLKCQKSATIVVGNSNLNNQNVENSEIFKYAAAFCGMALTNEVIREIPLTKRYLPLPQNNSSLSKRMKYEVILTFQKN